jgi:hypothetical protein
MYPKSEANVNCGIPTNQDRNEIFYVLIGLAFMFISYFLNTIRKQSAKIIDFSLLSIGSKFIIFGLNFVSDIVFLFFLLRGSYIFDRNAIKVFACFYIFGRILNPCALVYFFFYLLRNKSSRSEYFEKMMDSEHWDLYKSRYYILVLLSILECPMLRYLPWLTSKYSLTSGGFPDITLFQICQYSTIIQCFISLMVQLILLIWKTNEQLGMTETCSFTFVVTSLTSLAVLLITCYESGSAFAGFYNSQSHTGLTQTQKVKLSSALSEEDVSLEQLEKLVILLKSDTSKSNVSKRISLSDIKKELHSKEFTKNPIVLV